MGDAEGAPGGNTWRKARERRRARWLCSVQAREVALPRGGETVGGFVLEAKVGSGGHGTVYRARRGGRLYAVKFLYLPRVGEWAQRELDVMLRLQRVGQGGLEGHGRWPDRAPLFQFIAMEYVRGLPLYEWAQRHNPSARRVAELLRLLALQLTVTHAVDVVHRDVKGENILVGEEGRPVLVDYGVSTYSGAPHVTGLRVPGSWHYLSPEAMRFERQRQGEERYPATRSDDVWALGVVLYRLLTNVMPFDGMDPDGLELAESIVSEEPVPPHVLNPRVPRALGELCMRLLEKAPEARLADASELGVALEGVLAGADAAWEATLCDPWGPDAAPTPEEVLLATEERWARWARLEAYERHHPRRGQPPALGEPSTPLPPTVTAPPTPVGMVTPAPSAPWSLRGWAAVVGAVLGLGMLFAAGYFLSLRAPRGPSVATPVASSSPGMAPVPPRSETPAIVSSQELALASTSPEGVWGAAPPRAETPAPVASATPSQDSTSVKTPPQTPPRKKTKKSSRRLARLVSTAATCTVLTGCLPAAQVRPSPAVEACPDGSLEAMSKLHISTGRMAHAVFTNEHSGLMPVREGAITVETIEELGQLPQGTSLTGQLFFREGRVHGRFTQARLPDGDPLPVCLIAWDGPDKQPGLGTVGEVGPETAQVSTTLAVMAVQRFE